MKVQLLVAPESLVLVFCLEQLPPANLHAMQILDRAAGFVGRLVLDDSHASRAAVLHPEEPELSDAAARRELLLEEARRGLVAGAREEDASVASRCLVELTALARAVAVVGAVVVRVAVVGIAILVAPVVPVGALAAAAPFLTSRRFVVAGAACAMPRCCGAALAPSGQGAVLRAARQAAPAAVRVSSPATILGSHAQAVPVDLPAVQEVGGHSRALRRGEAGVPAAVRAAVGRALDHNLLQTPHRSQDLADLQRGVVRAGAKEEHPPAAQPLRGGAPGNFVGGHTSSLLRRGARPLGDLLDPTLDHQELLVAAVAAVSGPVLQQHRNGLPGEADRGADELLAAQPDELLVPFLVGAVEAQQAGQVAHLHLRKVAVAIRVEHFEDPLLQGRAHLRGNPPAELQRQSCARHGEPPRYRRRGWLASSPGCRLTALGRNAPPAGARAEKARAGNGGLSRKGFGDIVALFDCHYQLTAPCTLSCITASLCCRVAEVVRKAWKRWWAGCG